MRLSSIERAWLLGGTLRIVSIDDSGGDEGRQGVLLQAVNNRSLVRIYKSGSDIEVPSKGF